MRCHATTPLRAPALALSLALALAIVCAPVPALAEVAAEPAARAEEVVVATQGGGESNAELLEGYVQSLVDESLGRGAGLSAQSAEERLSGVDLALYTKLKELAAKVAAGEETSAVLEVPVSELGVDVGPWTAAELGVDAIVEDGEITEAAVNAA